MTRYQTDKKHSLFVRIDRFIHKIKNLKMNLKGTEDRDDLRTKSLDCFNNIKNVHYNEAILYLNTV